MKKVMHSHFPTNLHALQIPKPQEMSLLYPQTFFLEGCPRVLILPAIKTFKTFCLQNHLH